MRSATPARSAAARALDRGRVGVEAEEARLRERLREDDRRRALTAAHVGDLRAVNELAPHPVEGGDKAADGINCLFHVADGPTGPCVQREMRVNAAWSSP